MGTKRIEYKIPLLSYKEGVHELTYGIGQEFIDDNKIEGVLETNLEMVVIFTKRENLHELEIQIQGIMSVECDRCLDAFEMPINTHIKLYVKSIEEGERFEQADEVLVIHPQDVEINFTQVAFEEIMLALPIQKIHPNNNCNKKMLQYIQKEEKIEKKTDSRWDSLKDLFDN